MVSHYIHYNNEFGILFQDIANGNNMVQTDGALE